MKEKIRVRIVVSGKVQGVWFRQKTKQKAEKLKVLGWIKNLFDNQVEAVFEGEKDKVREMVKWAQKGPPLAKVKSLILKQEDCTNEFNRFEIRDKKYRNSKEYKNK